MNGSANKETKIQKVEKKDGMDTEVVNNNSMQDKDVSE